MKQPLLVLLLLLAYTKVTIGRNVSDSLVLSSNGLSSVRNLKLDTTSGTSNQAENAEERFSGPRLIEIAVKVGQKGKTLLSGKTPEMLFLKLDFKKKAELVTSRNFVAWVRAVEKRDGEKAGNNIIRALRDKIDEPELASMLYEAKDVTPLNKKGKGPYDYLLSYWKEKDQIGPVVMFKAFKKIKDPDPSLPFIWLDYALHFKMDPKKVETMFYTLNAETLFRKLDFRNKADLVTSRDFVAWVRAVEKRDGEKAGNNIISVLRDKIDEPELASMLYEAKGVTPLNKEGKGPYDYLLSYWYEHDKIPPELMLEVLEKHVGTYPLLRHVWNEYALRVHNRVIQERAIRSKMKPKPAS